MLSEDERSTLVDIIERCHNGWDLLNDWEKGFVGDQIKRYEEYGSDIRLSPKQWEMMRKIEDVLVNGRSRR